MHRVNNKKKKPWSKLELYPVFTKKTLKLVAAYREAYVKNKGGRRSGKNSFFTTTLLDKRGVSEIKKVYLEGYGFKVIARELGFSYSVLRNLCIKVWNIPARYGYDVSTKITRDFRSARIAGKYSFAEIQSPKRKYWCKGIQGRFKSKSGKKFWLRSTWEYIYAKWLDKNNIKWTHEERRYKLKDNHYYTPDFFIYKRGKIKYLVEIKGWYKNRVEKVDLFRESYDIPIILIDSIDEYTSIGYKKELTEWKNVRQK